MALTASIMQSGNRSINIRRIGRGYVSIGRKGNGGLNATQQKSSLRFSKNIEICACMKSYIRVVLISLGAAEYCAFRCFVKY